MSIRETRTDDAWPGWLEPLRPDELARERMRRGILRAAAPLLAARHPARWWELAADWSGLAAPIAAAIALLFAWIAYEASPAGVEPERQEMEALVLLNQAEPSTDGVLEATLRREGP